MNHEDLIVREIRMQGERIIEAIRRTDAHREGLYLRLVALLHAELQGSHLRRDTPANDDDPGPTNSVSDARGDHVHLHPRPLRAPAARGPRRS